MFKTILVPTDGTPLSTIAVNKAIEFAKLNSGSRIVAISVAEMMPFATVEGIGLVDPGQYEKSMRDLAQKNVDQVAEAAKTAGISCQSVIAQSASPSDEILKAASEYASDCIFMASHGRKGMDRVLLGSNTQRVLSQAKVPVIVYRPEVAPQPSEGAQWDLMGF